MAGDSLSGNRKWPCIYTVSLGADFDHLYMASLL
jgi:hypothetical protein